MEVVNAYLGRVAAIVGLAALIGLLWILSDLGRRLGEVHQMPKYWRLYDFAIATTIAFFVMRFTVYGAEGSLFWVTALGVFNLGLTAASYATLKYWGWLWRKAVK